MRMLITRNLYDVMTHLLKHRDVRLHVSKIADQTNLPTGTVSPLLRRYLERGWLTDEWTIPTQDHPNALHIYRINPERAEEIAGLLAASRWASSPAGPPSP